MDEASRLLTFRLAERRFGLDLTAVRRVVRAVEVSPVTEAPPGVLGVIDVQGQVVPVVDARVGLGLPTRPLRTEDRFILTAIGDRLAALKVDAVEEIVELPAERVVTGEAMVPGWALSGVLSLDGEMLLTCDPERLLQPVEALDLPLEEDAER